MHAPSGPELNALRCTLHSRSWRTLQGDDAFRGLCRFQPRVLQPATDLRVRLNPTSTTTPLKRSDAASAERPGPAVDSGVAAGTDRSAGASPSRPLRLADLHGLSRLGIDAVIGVTDVVELMHRAVTSGSPPLGPPVPGRTTGLTGLVYGAVRGVTRGVGWGLDTVLGLLPQPAGPSTPERDAWLSALNGVWGDHLDATGNPLAIRLALRIDGRPWRDGLRHRAMPPSGRLLVQVHGLAMNDHQWRRAGHDHADALASELGYTPVQLHYNSGRPIGRNGIDFSAALDALVADWPVPVERLVLLGHSMGGLVSRSACRYGAGRPWMRRLTDLICLGTPHHGAPLERGGRLVDAALGLSPYAAPLARLGGSRSAGIQDLRLGRVSLPDDELEGDRCTVPLPAGVRAYAVAALFDDPPLRRRRAVDAAQALLGDGLVPLSSALGDHADATFDLGFATDRRLVIRPAHHWDLLNHPAVSRQLREWLA